MAKFKIIGLKKAITNIQKKANAQIQSESTLRRIGSDIVSEIKDSTASYKNPKTGRGYKKYSKEYAKQKGVPRSNVDLRLTGKMMASLRAIVKRGKNKGSVIVDVTGARNKKIAGYHQNGTDKMPRRPFLFISQKTLTRIINKVKLEIIKRLS